VTLGRTFAGVALACSRKQSLVARSSTEAELNALTEATVEILHLRGLLVELGVHLGPSRVYQDNLSTITLVEKGLQTMRSRHMTVRVMWLNEQVIQREISLVACRTHEMIADGLTKDLGTKKFLAWRSIIMPVSP
jgi:hypothetical protein